MMTPGDQSGQEIPVAGKRRLVFDLVGFLIGIGLLVWLVLIAVREGNWQLVFDADPRLIAGLLGCTVLSALLAAATFWITVRPVRNLGFLELQGVNLVASMLNYAPIRLGMISRFAWHMRVDRMRFLDVVAWFTAVAVLIGAGLVICSLATLVQPNLGPWWFVLVIVLVTMTGCLLAFIPRIGLVQRHGRGLDRILSDRGARWGGLVFRVLDFGTFAGRIAFALAILGIQMAPSHVIVLAVVALLAGLIPVGRLGFREVAVAWTASRLGGEMQVDVPWEQMALIESGGEILVFLPIGLLVVPWFALGLRRRSRTSKRS